jgi:hypothetical protein
MYSSISLPILDAQFRNSVDGVMLNETADT